MHKSAYHFEPKEYQKELIGIVSELLKISQTELDQNLFNKKVEKILKKYPKDGSKLFSRDQLLKGIEFLNEQKIIDNQQQITQLTSKLKLKPTRTISGVTTVTVLTKPFACPGKCIFCPNDVRMPKSYIATEPGAQRALANRFSPYLQTWNRLQALKNIGHPTEKIELLVLGGTWSSYSVKYQIWFISECFRAMNEFGVKSTSIKKDESTSKANTQIIKKDPSVRKIDSAGFLYEDYKVQIKGYLESDYNDELRDNLGNLPYNKLVNTKEFKEHFKKFLCSEESALPPEEGWKELEKLQQINANAHSRCVGLVLETRPDAITPRETLRLRKLGATKIQLGIQILNDTVSTANKRGEGMKETARAFNLLRAAGFKIHAHIMPNLYKATPEIDLKSYKDLFNKLDYKPDEVKIYPTSTIKHTELYELYEAGKYQPYDTQTLVDLVANMIEQSPEYSRLTRIIRDIPSTEIEAGNKTTNLREVVEYKLIKEGRANPNIRAREVKGKKIKFEDLKLDIIKYKTTWTEEYFLQYITTKREIAGFLRLSIPKKKHKERAEYIHKSRREEHFEYINPITAELNDCAMIREVHVYGPSLEISTPKKKKRISSPLSSTNPITNSLAKEGGEAQHIGLGTKLIEKAKEISKESGFSKLAVISSIGTREYYKKRGFFLEEFYQIAQLD